MIIVHFNHITHNNNVNSLLMVNQTLSSHIILAKTEKRHYAFFVFSNGVRMDLVRIPPSESPFAYGVDLNMQISQKPRKV